ncbi:SURF1 family protein [Aquibium carbonis]|uniref:SURF1-like protein n=1 Tax=Aquibium carbonis TaxID=2495581 RepID=A0A3S0A9Q1_9HYPH|nr:SURF1 family protein [Aquibium carbonis]RST87887.1 SURF1 family protein [Aquibium carbonis]
MTDDVILPRRGRLAVVLALIVGAVAFATLLMLGNWQVQRLHWKEALLATIEARIHAEPRPLDEVLSSGPAIADLEYTPVTLEGVFVHAAERHFFATWKGASGFFIYTPLRRPQGDHVFVNRGFVPYDRKDPATRPQSLVEQPVEITGLLRAPLVEKPSSILPDNDPSKNLFYWKDIRAMADSSGLPDDLPVLGLFADANEAPNPGGLPIGGVTIIDQPNNHLQYAVTWYGLAAALAVVLGIMLWRNFRR